MKIVNKTLSLLFIVYLILSIMSSFIPKNIYITKDFNNIDLNGIDNIMIVAHPDDEIIWGGSHLLDGNYLVVCITAGNNYVRAKEFIEAMNITEDKYIMLGYPDRTFNKRNNWSKVKNDIINDLKEILSLKEWSSIVTHNPEGEYGHIHHKMTSQIVTEIYEETYSKYDNLYYFGKYYSKSNMKSMSNSENPVSNNNLTKKLAIIKETYTSQYFIMQSFGHMVKYENWIKYSELKRKGN